MVGPQIVKRSMKLRATVHYLLKLTYFRPA